MQQSPQVVFAAEDVAAAELQPFRHAGVDSQTSTEFKWVVWKEPAHITLVYAWTISGGVTGESGKQRKRKAASGLGALLAALRHHHGPDDTAQLEVEADYQEWRRVDSGSGTAEERLKAIEYLEKRLGVASGGSWNDALALQEGAKRPADDPPAGRPGKAPCRGEAQGSGQGKAPAASSRVSCTCRCCPALLRLLSSQAQGSGKDKARAAMANLGELSSACSPPSAFVRLAHSDTALAQRMHLDLLDLPLDILGQVADMLDVSCLQRLSRTCAYSFGVFFERCKARTQWRNSIRSVRQKAEDKLTRKRERTGCRVSMEANEELLREEMCAAKASLACALKECWDFLRGQKYPGEVAAGRGQPQQDPNKSLTLEDESWLHEQYVIHVNSMTNATGRMEPRAPVDGRALRGQICALGCSMAGSRSTRGQARAPDRSGWAPLMETLKKWKSAAEIAFRSRRQELLKAQTGTA